MAQVPVMEGKKKGAWGGRTFSKKLLKSNAWRRAIASTSPGASVPGPGAPIHPQNCRPTPACSILSCPIPPLTCFKEGQKSLPPGF